jgi:hypothetical protein
MSGITRNILLLCVWSVACTGSGNTDNQGPADDTAASPNDTGALQCDSLEPVACAERSDCTIIRGYSLEDDGSGGLCYDLSDPSEGLGCMSADQTCDGALTYGRPAGTEEQCTLFMSGCLPADWEMCGSFYTDECVD